MNWILCSDRLPPEGKYVLAKHSRGTWVDEKDQKNVNSVVVQLKHGISTAQRDAMRECRRKNEIHREDQHGNNLVPYGWDTFGPDYFFGQDIYCWLEIPECPFPDPSDGFREEQEKRLREFIAATFDYEGFRKKQDQFVADWFNRISGPTAAAPRSESPPAS